MTEYQIPRNSLAWMLAAQAAVILPHVARLPAWIILVCVSCGFWRIMVYQGRLSYPGKLIKVIFVICGLVGLVAGYRSFGLEPATGLLIITFVLKLLEMQRKRDAYIVIFLAYFVALTEFLFNQTIAYTLYMSLVITMITAALIGLNQTRSHLNPFKTFRKAGVLLSQSLPLMIVLFVLFPRVTPLWTVPTQSQTARSGVSDTMSPGDITRLVQSDDLAFRVTFDGDIPPLSRLYWRGLVLSRFDGRTWRHEASGLYRPLWFAGGQKPDWAERIELLGDSVRYTVMLEPTWRNWVFSLSAPVRPPEDDMPMLKDFRLYSAEPLRQRTRYELTSYLDYRYERELPEFWRYRATLLPEQINPRTRELADAFFAESGDAERYINRVLQMFREQNFSYTLRPPALGDNSIDDFIFNTRAGFCEHFAGAFTFMMRAAGVPARVVVGYLGGEYNPIGNYVAVYQFDAHAWSEVWLEGRGWVRIDPTATVAPERIERGLQAALEEEASFLSENPLSWLRYRQTLWLTELRLQLSAIALYWDSWVVGYTPEVQMGLLTRYFGDLNGGKLGFIMLAAFFSMLAVIGAVILMKRSRRIVDPLDGEYLRFCNIMVQFGLERKNGEGPLTFANRIEEVRPDLARAAREVTDIYVEQNYASSDGDASRLKRAIRNFRVKALTANA